jgi:hypothetical protein
MIEKVVVLRGAVTARDDTAVGVGAAEARDRSLIVAE